MGPTDQTLLDLSNFYNQDTGQDTMCERCNILCCLVGTYVNNNQQYYICNQLYSKAFNLNIYQAKILKLYRSLYGQIKLTYPKVLQTCWLKNKWMFLLSFRLVPLIPTIVKWMDFRVQEPVSIFVLSLQL